jgi:hypothetical protein
LPELIETGASNRCHPPKFGRVPYGLGFFKGLHASRAIVEASNSLSDFKYNSIFTDRCGYQKLASAASGFSDFESGLHLENNCWGDCTTQELEAGEQNISTFYDVYDAPLSPIFYEPYATSAFPRCRI